jgi:hypothetical protein
MVVAGGLTDLACDRPLGALKGVHSDDRGEQRRPHYLAPAGAFPFL